MLIRERVSDMSTGSAGPAVARALVSAELKRLRADSKETQEAVAKACEWSVAKFSRIENGTSSVTKADLESLLHHYGVDEVRITELVEPRPPGPDPGMVGGLRTSAPTRVSRPTSATRTAPHLSGISSPWWSQASSRPPSTHFRPWRPGVSRQMSSLAW